MLPTQPPSGPAKDSEGLVELHLLRWIERRRIDEVVHRPTNRHLRRVVFQADPPQELERLREVDVGLLVDPSAPRGELEPQ